MKQPITLLVAEDNSDDVFLLKEAFQKSHVSLVFHAVRDGLEAMAYLKGDGAFADRGSYPLPDVLLLDLNMPRCNGFEVLEWLRQQPGLKTIATHVLTASARPADVQRAYDLGARSYLVKPTRIDDLIAFAAALHAWHRFVVAWPTSPETGAHDNHRPASASAHAHP